MSSSRSVYYSIPSSMPLASITSPISSISYMPMQIGFLSPLFYPFYPFCFSFEIFTPSLSLLHFISVSFLERYIQAVIPLFLLLSLYSLHSKLDDSGTHPFCNQSKVNILRLVRISSICQCDIPAAPSLSVQTPIVNSCKVIVNTSTELSQSNCQTPLVNSCFHKYIN